MASEQEELLEQLKEIVESLKGVSQYSKDLASAVSSANRPMQQMSDLSKAISTSMESMAGASKESIAAMTEMTTAAGSLVTKMSEYGREESESVKRLNEQKLLTEETRTATAQMALERRRQWAEMSKAQEEENKALKETHSAWDGIKKSISDVTLLKKGWSTDAISRGNTMAQGLTGQGSMEGGLSNLTGSLSALAPTAAGVGGLLGMLIYGQVKKAEFIALGQVAIQQFDLVGGKVGEFGQKLTDMSKSLSVAGMIEAKDIALVSGALVSFGVDIDGAKAKVDDFTSAGGSSFLAFTLSVDKAFEMAAGSAAKFGGTLVRDFNMSTKEAAENLKQMASAAMTSGQNVQVFMQQTMEASSALRLLNANQEAVYTTQQMGIKAYRNAGFNQQFSGAYASQGMGQVSGAIGGGMNEGVRAIIAQQMFGGDALDALAKLNSPIARGSDTKLDINAFIEAAGGIMGRNGQQGVGAQYKFTESVFGVGTAGADLLLKAFSEQKATGSVAPETKKALEDALANERLKKSSLELAVDKIQQAVADTMVGLLTSIVSGLKLLYNGVMYGFTWLMSNMPGASKQQKEIYGIENEEYRRMIKENIAAMGVGGSQMAQGLRTMGSGVSDIAETTLGSGGTELGGNHKKVLDATKAAREAMKASEMKTLPAAAQEALNRSDYFGYAGVASDVSNGVGLLKTAASAIWKWADQEERKPSGHKSQAPKEVVK